MTSRTKELGDMITEKMHCGTLLHLWVIVKDDSRRGVITSRHPQEGDRTTAYVTLEMNGVYPGMNEDEEYVYGYGHCGGLDSDNRVIAEILTRNSKKLKKYYGVEIPEEAGNLRETWTGIFRQSGYEVMRVL